MLDIKFIRENAEIVKMAIGKKRLELDLEVLLKLDRERLGLLTSVEGLRAKQNEAGAVIAGASDVATRERLIGEMEGLKRQLQAEEGKLKEVMINWKKLMLEVPNIPDASVPEGDSDANNLEIRTVGEKPQFDFTPKTHLELVALRETVDFERAASVAGFRGYFLSGELVRLSLALWQLALDHLTAKGFTPMLVPSLLKPEPFLGTGYLPQGVEDLYKTQDGNYLSGTAEVASMGYFMDSILPVEKLPQQIVAFSPCFRREAGSHGKDTKGLMRVHEFFKVEQVVLCEANHEESVRFHEALTKNAEELMQLLGLPYRVVVNCTGDLGLGQVKKYDIEAWLPGAKEYRETHSISYFNDFQTRRLNIRYRAATGETRFAHSLNGTALATPRLLVAILENYQQADGSLKLPSALVPYFRQ